MEPTLRIIYCPCCKAVLYTLKLGQSNGRETWRLSKDSPLIRTDDQGTFMNCPRCGRRIKLIVADELESPGFELADHQDCGAS